MIILRKVVFIIVSSLVSFNVFAITELFEIQNQTARQLNMVGDFIHDNVEVTFPAMIAPKSTMIKQADFDVGVNTDFSKVRLEVSYQIKCPNGLRDYLKISAYPFVIPNPRQISYDIRVEAQVEGDHCVKLLNDGVDLGGNEHHAIVAIVDKPIKE